MLVALPCFPAEILQVWSDKGIRLLFRNFLFLARCRQHQEFWRRSTRDLLYWNMLNTALLVYSLLEAWGEKMLKITVMARHELHIFQPAHCCLSTKYWRFVARTKWDSFPTTKQISHFEFSSRKQPTFALCQLFAVNSIFRCLHQPNVFAANPTRCSATEATPVIEKLCHGRRVCHVIVSPATFESNPNCGNYPRYLTVTYACGGKHSRTQSKRRLAQQLACILAYCKPRTFIMTFTCAERFLICHDFYLCRTVFIGKH